MKTKKFLTITTVYLSLLILVKLINYSPVFYNSNIYSNGINLIPFETTTAYITNFSNYNTSILLKVFLSLFIFTPLAIFLGVNFKENNKKLILFLFLNVITFSILVRALKIGYFDIDILLLRFLIATVFLLISKKFTKKLI